MSAEDESKISYKVELTANFEYFLDSGEVAAINTAIRRAAQDAIDDNAEVYILITVLPPPPDEDEDEDEEEPEAETEA